jgi:LPS export ABC transporter protein LptC
MRGGRVPMSRARRALFLLTAMMAVILACQREKMEPAYESENLPDQEILDFTLVETEDGRKSWVLEADSAAVFDQRKQILITSPKVNFYDEDGTVFSTMHADRGILDSSTNDMEASGDVLAVSSDGTRLETQSIRWSNEENLILSDDYVEMTKDGDVISGYGLRTDPALNDIRILRDVRARGSAEEAIIREE